jgi:hypothetical protein
MQIRWFVDFPVPGAPEAPWTNVGDFRTRREAVEFLVSKYNIQKTQAQQFISRVES